MFEDYAKMGPEKVTGVEILKGFASFPVVALGGKFFWTFEKVGLFLNIE